MKLVIVESPTKAKTISRFLSSDYKVESSFGHVRDLPETKMGIDIEHDFKPHYVILSKAKKHIARIKKSLKDTNKVILATDEDREGEAIAWHLIQALGLENSKWQNHPKPTEIRNSKLKIQRIVFHEITKRAIEEALRNPRKIDSNLVNAQQARRILDRLVGYELSPFLWKKVARGLSAGRVQSLAVRLVVDREQEIKKFQPEEYWTIVASLLKIKNQKPYLPAGRSKVKNNKFEAKLVKKDGKTIPKLGIKSKKEADEIVKELGEAEYKVIDIEKQESKRNPLPPLATSTLQQEAWQKLHFPVNLTMSIAQNLYERGLITYHRTDSLNLSDQALFSAKKFITEHYGRDYWAGFFRKFKTRTKRAQEAHEAIRPTNPTREPKKIKNLDERQYKLYSLIWKRMIASQMAPAVIDLTTININAKNYIFEAIGSVIRFDGFLKIYDLKLKEAALPSLEKNETLKLIRLIPTQHFTQPPPRYTEATLIKMLEKHGIGRPSTYAPILSTIQERNYVEKDENKKFCPTELGIIVNDLLVEHFPKIVDVEFTADMEENLDKIAAGGKNWVPIIRTFYVPFKENLIKKTQEVSKKELIEQPTEKKCPKCNNPLVIKLGRFGKFCACSNFPKCRYTEPIIKSTGVKCPKCKRGEIIEKKTKKGKLFYSCSRYPDCKFALWKKPTGEKCPRCSSLLIEENKDTIKCSNKECDYKHKIKNKK